MSRNFGVIQRSMDKLAAFIVEKRKLILIVTAVLLICSIAAMFFVDVNLDMSKYLPKDSLAKKGVSVMTEEFGAQSAINVMFKGLDRAQQTEIQKGLAEIKNVSGVLFEAESEDYNKDGKSLFAVSLAVDTFSNEATDTLNEIKEKYGEKYDMYTTGAVVDRQYIGVGLTTVAAALAIILFILFTLSSSYLEPLLFLVAIGVAVILNNGTNALLPDISVLTNSIGAILQLVLSMDYSIMLVDRYHQERQTSPDKGTAMKNALKNGFLAIAGSSVTTIIGLLCLVFMSFTIGRDMGIVLAKGVFFCLVSILFVLPGLILIFDKQIEKTKKKTPVFKMDKIASFCYKGRYAVLLVFLAVFAVGFMLKDDVLIDFSMSSRNPDIPEVEETFAPTNPVILLYKNSDESKAADLVTFLEKREGVKSVNAYENTLGKEFTASELADYVGMDASMLQVIFYNYFHAGEINKLSMQEFISYLSNDIMKNEQFARFLNDDIRSQLEQMKLFGDKNELSQPRGAAELASLFNIDESMINQLLMYYYSKLDSAETDKMTLPQFVSFLKNDVSKNAQFSSYLNADMLSQIDMFAKFTDKAAINKEYSAGELAKLFDMDSEMIQQVFFMKYHEEGNTAGWKMSVNEFLELILQDVAKNPAYASYFDSATLEQIRLMKKIVDLSLSGDMLASGQIAELVGMDTTLINMIFLLKGADVTNMTFPDFIDFLINDVSKRQLMSAFFDEETMSGLKMMKSMIDAAMKGENLDIKQFSALMGMEESMLSQLFFIKYKPTGIAEGWTLSLYDFVSYILTNMSGNTQFSQYMDAAALSQLKTVKSLMDGALTGNAFDYSEIASMTGMDAATLKPLFLYRQSLYGDTSGWKISLEAFINFIIDDVAKNEEYKSMFSSDILLMLSSAKTMIDAVTGDALFTPAELFAALPLDSAAMDESMLELVFLYINSIKNADNTSKLTIYGFMNYISDVVLKDSRFAAFFDEEIQRELSDAKGEIEKGKNQLISKNYSRIVINTTYKEESEGIFLLIDELYAKLKEFDSAYLVGNSPVAHEMKATFTKELNFITVLTILSVFLVVAITFRSIAVPAILVMLIQCAVFMTTAAAYFQGTGTYYVAMLIVQAILMGATIDYAILFTEYYREKRKFEDKIEALKNAFKGSIMTIVTSSSILCLVTLAVGVVIKDPTTSQVCLTISKGCFFAVVLVIFVLPALLAVFDRLVVKKEKKRVKNKKLKIENEVTGQIIAD